MTDKHRNLRSNSKDNIEMAEKAKSPNKKSTLTIQDLRSALNEQDQRLTTVFQEMLRESLKVLKEQIDKQNEKIVMLENVITNQASHIDKIDNYMKRKYAILQGVPEDKDETQLEEIIIALDANLEKSFKPIRLGKKTNDKNRPIKLKFINENEKRNTVNKSRDVFKENEAFNNIYLNYDESTYRRLENGRLRRMKKENKAKYPDKDIQLQKGQLLMDNNVIDKYNIKNQIFQKM